MDRLLEGLIWGVFVAAISLFNWQAWVILAITALFPILASWRRSKDPSTSPPIPPIWELWLGFSAPFILASVRAFLLPALGVGIFEGGRVTLPILLVIWILELFLLLRHRNRGISAWVLVVIVCFWSWGVFMISICTMTRPCQQIF